MNSLEVLFSVSGVKTYIFIPPLIAFVISFFTSMGGISEPVAQILLTSQKEKW